MFNWWRSTPWLLILVCLVGGSVGPSPTSGAGPTPPPQPRYSKALTLGPELEWRFQPIVVDLNGDGWLDLAVTARLVTPGLHLWRGGAGLTFTPVEPTWTDIGYAVLATGDINYDGVPDLVAASHSSQIQTLLSDGKGGFAETLLQGKDGYVAAQLADVNGDGKLDLILLGYEKAGIELYVGDGAGHWTLHTTLPAPLPEQPLLGRALIAGDLNHDGHVDIVAAFNSWGLYIYYGNGQGGFTGGPVDFIPPRAFGSIGVSLALGDVNHDGHPDLILNGTSFGRGEPNGPNGPNGPDVYLGDGRGGWQASSQGLKALKMAAPGLALGDLDGDGNLDILAGGNVTGHLNSGYGLFWFRGDGKGGWQLVQESGLPPQGLPFPESVALADLDRDGVPEIITLHGGVNGNITIWKRQ